MNRSRLEFCCCVKDSAQTTVPALEDGHEHDMISGKHEGLRLEGASGDHLVQCPAQSRVN